MLACSLIWLCEYVYTFCNNFVAVGRARTLGMGTEFAER